METLMPLFNNNKPELSQRALHLDLKGLPPTPERLLQLPRIAALGRYNALVVEWEDSFPWTCDKSFRSPSAYTPEQVRAFVKEAKKHGLEIIPLVQCIGHMETPLRNRPELREISNRPEVINVLAPGACELIESMIDDILALMPEVSFFHLGGDEARSFGTHPDTAKYIDEHGKAALYMSHVAPLLDKLGARSIRPILWHDMMCEWDDLCLRRLATKADLCVWHYHGDPAKSSRCAPEVLERFKHAGVNLWLGAAYKGADGADADLPNSLNRFVNAEAWMRYIKDYDFVGGIATGWSRHSAFGIQNEPVDAALDVMIGVGVILHDGIIPSIENCVKMLDDSGEGESFRKRREIMFKLADSRRAAWHMAVQIYQQAAMEGIDPTRRNSRNLETLYGYLDMYITDAEAAAAEILDSFGDLVSNIWLKEYTSTRLDALYAVRDDLRRHYT